MLMDGAIVMAVGMGSVFVFLGLMVFLMVILARLMQNFPEDMETEESDEKGLPACTEHEDIAVILAAVKAHMKGIRK